MALLENQYRALSNYLNTIYNEASKEAIAEMVGPSIFDVTETPFRTFDHRILHGVTGIELVGDGQTYPSATGVQGKYIALLKSSLINGEILKAAFRRLMETLRKALCHLQRLSEKTLNMREATV